MLERRVGCVPQARTLHTKQAGDLRGVMGYLKNENTGFQVAFCLQPSWLLISRTLHTSPNGLPARARGRC